MNRFVVVMNVSDSFEGEFDNVHAARAFAKLRGEVLAPHGMSLRVLEHIDVMHPMRLAIGASPAEADDAQRRIAAAMIWSECHGGFVRQHVDEARLQQVISLFLPVAVDWPDFIRDAVGRPRTSSMQIAEAHR